MVKNRRQPVIEFQEKHKLKSECKPRKKKYTEKSFECTMLNSNGHFSRSAI